LANALEKGSERSSEGSINLRPTGCLWGVERVGAGLQQDAVPRRNLDGWLSPRSFDFFYLLPPTPRLSKLV